MPKQVKITVTRTDIAWLHQARNLVGTGGGISEPMRAAVRRELARLITRAEDAGISLDSQGD